MLHRPGRGGCGLLLSREPETTREVEPMVAPFRQTRGSRQFLMGSQAQVQEEWRPIRTAQLNHARARA